MILVGDFGGTIVKLGLVENNEILIYEKIASPASCIAADWLPLLKKSIESMCGSAGVRIRDLEGMVWAMPMVIDPGLRRARWTFGKFDDVMHDEFANNVEEYFGIPLLLENDARAAAIGEWQAGAGRGFEDLVMVTLGTGIGTAVIQQGQPLRGRSGMAGNLGGLSITHLGTSDHQKVAPGCIEGYVASWALPHRVVNMAGYQQSCLSTEKRIDYRAIFSCAAAGDLLAIELREQAIEAWSALIINFIQSFDPACVIIGGGIMASAETILPPIREFINRHAILSGGTVAIFAAEQGDQAALLGCEWIWRNQRK
jgi:glucokinase